MDWVLAIAGFALLMTGGEVVVQGAIVIAKRMCSSPADRIHHCSSRNISSRVSGLSRGCCWKSTRSSCWWCSGLKCSQCDACSWDGFNAATSDPGRELERDAKAMMFALVFTSGAVYLGEISIYFGALMLVSLIDTMPTLTSTQRRRIQRLKIAGSLTISR